MPARPTSCLGTPAEAWRPTPAGAGPSQAAARGVAAIEDGDDLTTGLSLEIRQKIVILNGALTT